MAKFYVGQPVICVDDRLRPNVVRRFPNMTWPKQNQRYIIRANIPAMTSNMGMLTFVLLREIRNRKERYPGGTFAELGFWEERFEPATDITLLENIKDFAGMQYDAFEKRTAPIRRIRKKEKT